MSRFILNLLAVTLDDNDPSLLSTRRIASRMDVIFAKAAHRLGADLDDSLFDDEEFEHNDGGEHEEEGEHDDEGEHGTEAERNAACAVMADA